MDAEVQVRDVKRSETRSGNTRWVLTDDAGREYTTFRPQIGEEAERYTGRRGDPARRAVREARAVQAARRGRHPRGRRPGEALSRAYAERHGRDAVRPRHEEPQGAPRRGGGLQRLPAVRP